MDVFNKIADVKREFIRFCKPFESCLCLNVKLQIVLCDYTSQRTIHRYYDALIYVDKAARGAKRLGLLKFNLQYLEHHKQGLHSILAKISYLPQMDALTKFKTLLEL